MFSCSTQYKWGYKKFNCIWSHYETKLIAWLGVPAAKFLVHYIKNPWAALAFVGGSVVVIYTAWKAVQYNQRLAMTIYSTYANQSYWATIWRTRN
jgi:hypothetical protein